eukprot:TRINITY_DN32171_c0_g1_i1.p1 TRINITY_DN32171_c0_g1~~TRINITY_DN32171_c0_g1_i1.p1  ORF type:complete len:111 (-),score=44.63 TRINITY_DN32171_c0_g1_i1:247-579(-)
MDVFATPANDERVKHHVDQVMHHVEKVKHHDEKLKHHDEKVKHHDEKVKHHVDKLQFHIEKVKDHVVVDYEDNNVKSDANSREEKKEDDLDKGLDAGVYDVSYIKAANLM